MKIDVTQVVLALLTLISGIVTTFLVPWLKQKLDAGQRERLAALIRVGVFAAQQLFRTDEGVRKKAYVIQLLQDQGYEINSEEIDARIEAELMALKISAGWKNHGDPIPEKEEESFRNQINGLSGDSE